LSTLAFLRGISSGAAVLGALGIFSFLFFLDDLDSDLVFFTDRSGCFRLDIDELLGE
jgi:hypothetical protein